MNKMANTNFRVGDRVMTPDGVGRITSFKEDYAAVAIDGDEPREGDIIVTVVNGVPVVAGTIHKVETQEGVRVRMLGGKELKLGTQVFNVSRELRVQEQREVGQGYLANKAMSPEDRALMASLGLTRLAAEAVQTYKSGNTRTSSRGRSIKGGSNE